MWWFEYYENTSEWWIDLTDSPNDELDKLLHEEKNEIAASFQLAEWMPPANADQIAYDALVDRIAQAKQVAEYTDLFATALDTYGLDAAIGMIPVVWDIASSALGIIFLLYWYQKTSLSKVELFKAVSAHLGDAGVGAAMEALNIIPWLGAVVWSVLDYWIKSHRYASSTFSKHLQQQVAQAQADGVDVTQLMLDVDAVLVGKVPWPMLNTLLKSKKMQKVLESLQSEL